MPPEFQTYRADPFDMASIKISGATAWQRAVKGRAPRWSDQIGRFSTEMVDVIHSPKFTIDKNDRFFCIGSCFARNIEEHLIYLGINVLSRKIISPKSEWPHRPNGIINKFTTHSMLNEIDWAIDPPSVNENMFEEQENGWLDLQLCPGVAPVSLERAIERRRYLIGDYFKRIRDATIIIVTLGLNEVWFDRTTERRLNAPPSFYATRRNPERYELHITDVTENLAELNKIRNMILSINSHAKIIVTVSPVPLSNTFSGRDIFIANNYSKSVLRSAADIFFSSYDDVDYFPSYDIISLSPRIDVFEKDCLHISDKIVGRMMKMFVRVYLGIEPDLIEFNERSYLKANPDVDAAVRRGEFASGFEYFQLSRP